MNGPGNHAEHIWPGLGEQEVSSEQPAESLGSPGRMRGGGDLRPLLPRLTILRKQKQGLLLESRNSTDLGTETFLTKAVDDTTHQTTCSTSSP